MPPKRRGHNLTGRDKLFGNAVEHVHVGVGYTVLGNFSLNLAAGSLQQCETSPHSAFFAELNELMLSNTSTDFKRFRYETLPLCESKAMLQHHHKTVAQKLLMSLSNKENNEGFFAFLKLSIAFARDMREKFLAYFEAFHQIVNAGMYDKSGQWIPDVTRLQLVFATQVAWLRELSPFLVLPQHQHIVQDNILLLFIRQMNDTKDYVRRLAGEVLASICRQQRKLFPLVLELAAANILLQQRKTAETPSPADPKAGSDDDNDDEAAAQEDDDDGEDAVKEDASSDDYNWAADPLVDGMTHFISDILRGIRGALNTNFEDTLYLLLVAVRFLSPEAARRHGQTTDDDEDSRGSLLALTSSWIHMTATSAIDAGLDTMSQEMTSCLHALARHALPEVMRMLMHETRHAAASSIEHKATFRILQSLVQMFALCDDTKSSHSSATSSCQVLLIELLVSIVEVDDHLMLHEQELDVILPLRSLVPRIAALLHPAANKRIGLTSDSSVAMISRLAMPFMFTSTLVDCKHADWLRTHVGSPVMAIISSLVTESAADSNGSVDVLNCAFGFFQDVLQKNRALCLHHERNANANVPSSESDEDDDAPSPSAAARAAKVLGASVQAYSHFLDEQLAVPLLSTILQLMVETARNSESAFTRALMAVLLASEKTPLASSSPLHSVLLRAPQLSATVLESLLFQEIKRGGAAVLAEDELSVEANRHLVKVHMSLNLISVTLAARVSSFTTLDAAIKAIEELLLSTQKRLAVAPKTGHCVELYAHCCIVIAQLMELYATPSASTKTTKAAKRSKSKTLLMNASQDSTATAQQSKEVVRRLAAYVEHLVMMVSDMCCSQTSAAVAADFSLTRSIGHTLEAIQMFVGTTNKHSFAASAIALCSRIAQHISVEGQAALMEVALRALSSVSQPVRLRALRLLKAVCFSDPAVVRIAGSEAVPQDTFDALIGAETADPLSSSGSLDEAKMHLTKVSFDAGVGRITCALQAKIVLHSSFGMLHIKFADLWPIAIKMISDLLRYEHDKDEKPLWEIVRRDAADIIFGSIVSASSSRKQPKKKTPVSEDDQDALTSCENSAYYLHFSDAQHHEEGSLVSRNFAVSKSAALSVMACLGDGQWCSLAVVEAALKAQPQSTDSVTVAKTLTSGLQDILKHVSSASDRKIEFVESLLIELASIDQGTHPTLSQLSSLEDRIVLMMNALVVSPSTATKAANRHQQHYLLRENAGEHDAAAQSSTFAARNAILTALFRSYLSNNNGKLQRAAIENLKRLRVQPFDSCWDKIIPFCGTNMKEAFSFASSFHVDTDIEETQRVEYIAVVMVVSIPALTQPVTKKKLKDQAVLSRRLMSYLLHTDGAGLAQILDRIMDSLLGSIVIRNAAGDDSSADAWTKFNFLQKIVAEQPRHASRRYEQVLKQLTITLKLIHQFVSSVGPRFAPWAETSLAICIRAYLFSCRSQHPSEWWATRSIPGAATAAATSLRKILGQTIVSIVDQFPDQIVGDSMQGDRMATWAAFVKELYANSKTLSSTSAQSHHNQRLSTGISSVFLKLILVWVKHSCLFPFVCYFGDVVVAQLTDALEPSAPGSDVVHRASSDTVYAALKTISSILTDSDEPFALIASKSQATLGSNFVDVHLEALFEPLYRLVLHGQAAENESGSSSPAARHRSSRNVMGFTLRMWSEVIQTVAMLAHRLSDDDGNVPLESTKKTSKKQAKEVAPVVRSSSRVQEILGQLLEIALKFVSNPICCADEEAIQTATSVVEALVNKVKSIHPSHHYRRIISLFNMVTNPRARLALCRIFQIAITKLDEAKVNDVCVLQYVAVSRAVFGLNSFTSQPNEDDEEESEAKPSREEDSSQPQEGSFDRYDFEKRYHCFHSLMTFFNNNGNYGALQSVADKKKQKGTARSSAAEDSSTEEPEATKGARTEALPASTVRHERQFVGEDDIRIPLKKDVQSTLSQGSMMMLASNIMFYLRDPERTIRSLASQTLFSMLRYTSSQGAEYSTTCLETIIRPIVLSSLRQGVVAKDPSIRLGHMESFGGLARFYPQQFPSFAALYSPNSERNFFQNIGHVQHKCRLNALSLLRKACGNMNVRDLLRVFVPFLLVSLKDFAQGKREGPSSTTEGRAKGFAECVTLTLASLVKHMPWDGYYYVLKLLLNNANQNESLRMTMLKGVVLVLQSFHFLDEMNAERPVNNKRKEVSAREAKNESDSDVDDEALVEGGGTSWAQTRSKWRHEKIISALEGDVLPQLYAFISTKRSAAAAGGGKHSETRVGDLTAEKAHSAAQGQPTENHAITQLPVAVAIAKIVKLFPLHSFRAHVEQLLSEIVLRLRTKKDKYRERARKVLCSVMREVGPGMLGFVITKLKDNFVHGYQLHVLGYTVVTMLYSLYAPASPFALLTRQQAKQLARSTGTASKADTEEVAAKQKQAAASSSDDDDDDVADEDGATTAPRNAFDEEEGRQALHQSMDLLFEIFLDDYLGEIGSQKEQIELMSTMMEVKHSRALNGFVFIATHCDATEAMTRFVQKIAWVLAPPTAQELSKKSGTAGSLILGTNTKYVSGGEKNGVADIKFVKKVRFLALRVAKALMTNKTLDVSRSLESVKTMLDRHHSVREEKIREFEAKDGTRRIRGNWSSHTDVKRKSFDEQYESNFAVIQRPERVDVDFNAPTVLLSSTQQKQKLKVYRGKYAKQIGEASKGFMAEDAETAIVLDTLDEFCLKFLLSALRRVLGIGKEKKRTSLPLGTDAAAAAEDNDAEFGDDEDLDSGEITAELMEKELDAEEADNANDDEEAEEQEKDQGEVADNEEEQAKKSDQPRLGPRKNALKKSKQISGVVETFCVKHRALLESLVPSVLSALQGEGSDIVISHSLDVMHALLCLRPPLESVATLGKPLFQTIVLLFARGGVIKKRALRVVASVVQHKRFQLLDEDAARLLNIVRSEVLEKSEFMACALQLLHAVLSKHSTIIEVYDIISLITETMMHCAHSPVIRARCVAILATFLTEYKLTHDKLRSHIDFYVRNLEYPNSLGRIALMELLDVLIFRFPTAVLKGEALVMFVPLCGVLCRCEWRECKEKAAVVLGHLIEYCSDLKLFAPVLAEWLGGRSISVRTSALQVLGVITPYVVRGYRNKSDTEASVLHDVEFAIPWIVSTLKLSGGEILTKKERKQRSEDPTLTEEAETKKRQLSKKEKVERDRKGWQPVFFALRSIEALIDFAPLTFFPQFGAECITHIFCSLIEHSHPWVQGAAVRICMKYLYQFVEPYSAFMETVCAPKLLAQPASEAVGMPCVCVMGEQTILEAEKQAATCAKFLKRVLATVENQDVANEKYEANRTIEEPLRQNTVKVAVYLIKAMVQLNVAILRTNTKATHTLANYKSVWAQVAALMQPALQGHSIDGYVVRTASVAQIIGGLLSTLPKFSDNEDDSDDAFKFAVEQVLRCISSDTVYGTVVPTVAAAMESQHDKLAFIGSKVADVVRSELSHRAREFRSISASGQDSTLSGSSETPKKKKARVESTNGAAVVIAEDVILALTKLVEERHTLKRDAQTKRLAKKAVKRSRTVNN